MKELNVKRIIYSVNDGIVKTNLKDFAPTVMSLGRQFIDNGYNTIFRDRKAERQITYNSETDSFVSDTSSISSDSSHDTISKRKYKRFNKYKRKTV